MEASNNFNSGMQSDISKLYQKPNTYLQALNFRNTNELGSSNGSLVNIKGNECSITFPTIQDIFKLKVYDNDGGGGNETITITINGQTTSNLSIGEGTLGSDIYNKLILLSNCYNNPSAVNPTFAVAYEDNFVVIYQQPKYQDCGPAVNSVFPNTTINTTVGATADWTVGWVNSSNTIQTNAVQVPWVLTNNHPIVIGSTFINESIYLLTQDYTNGYPSPPNPATDIPLNDSFVGVGHIWKLDIDDITRQNTLTLLYTNYLDFTKAHPIAPSAITGRYESDLIQRIYWTDFYNKIRTLNVANPNLMAFDPNLLSVSPSVSFEIPLLNNFISGSLPQGTYELSYRLKKINTSVSNYAQSSNMVNLLNDPNDTSDAAYISYEGPSGIGNSSRGIQWLINNIDTNFDSIEVVIIYRSTKTALPTIYKMSEDNIGNYSSKVINVSTLADLDTIPLDEYINVSSGFTHAKTVDTKDNRLFWGNVYSSKSRDLSSKFDARAFRAKTSGGTDIKVINAGVPTSYANLAAAIASPISNDSINEYYDSTGAPGSNACYYLPGTTKLGGAGANISYEFGTENILLSDLSTIEGSSGDWLIRTTVPFNMKQSASSGIAGVTNPEDLILGSTDSNDQVYPIRGVATSKNPYFTSVLKGFQHEEIYRFGIQFFDLSGNPFFTEWIGDIKMPGMGDTNDNPGPISVAQSITDFRNSFIRDSNMYGQSMYIKFTVNVSSIQDLISGYQIVRVERTDNNKTILGCGMLTNPFVDTTTLDAVIGGGLLRDNKAFPPVPLRTGVPYNPMPNQGSIETLSWATNNQSASRAEKLATFDCFDMFVGTYAYQSGDKILIRAKSRPINRQNALNGVGNPRYRIGFDQALMDAWLDNASTVGTLPNGNDPVFDGVSHYITGFDSQEMPFYLLFYEDYTFYTNIATHNKSITKSFIVGPGETIAAADTGVVDFKNFMRSYGPNVDSSIPGIGSKTILLTFSGTGTDYINSGDGTYFADDTNGDKLIGLYYRPNPTQYGGNTYSARTNNEYIACGSYIPIKRNNLTLTNNLNITFKNFGGDVFLNYWDHQKVSKGTNSTPFTVYQWSGGTPGSLTDTTDTNFNTSVTCYFACTNQYNQNVRYGDHIDTQLTVNTYGTDDSYAYNFYHSNEKNVIKFFPKPLNFVLTDKWVNRVHYSQIKINNETEDNWAVYPTNQFYDVEGNYGEINCLISLNSQLHYIQDRGIGVLIVNPVAIVDGGIGANIKLGVGSVIQRHQYKALDIGTKHQWSVAKSQSQIIFADIRHKKLYSYNGEQITPISDTLGQRNYFVKRFHGDILTTDNPVDTKGILSTYDYYHNEFIITVVNDTGGTAENGVDEYNTISYSELTGKFVSMYSFKPNIYINNHKYLLSNINNGSNKLRTSLYLHNYGNYGTFYDTVYPSSIKVLCNDNPLYTKIFDNLVWLSESIKDNIEWSDDLNLYPGSITSPSYVDDVNNQEDTFDTIRCYNDWQNTDFTTLTLAPPNNNLTRKERNFNLQIPRNKFNYDTTLPSTISLFDPSKLNKITYGERIRDKFMIVDLSYANSINNRFIIHNLKTKYRISDR